MKFTNTPACIRCGTCCLITTCHLGTEDPITGYCNHLFVHPEDYTTTCMLYQQKPVLFSEMIGVGCVLRMTEEIYNMYLEFYNIDARKRDVIRRQIIEANNKDTVKTTT